VAFVSRAAHGVAPREPRGWGEGHLMMLEHYQHAKNLLVSYSPEKLGFF
jgi:aldehyde dehydrogenase